MTDERQPDGGGAPAESPEEEAVEDLIEDLVDVQETVASREDRRVIRRAIRTLDRVSRGQIFGLDDLAQQVVGGFILSAPFVVTEEVWNLAASMNGIQWAITVVFVFAIGYGALYRADDTHDADRERSVVGLPVRYLSLLVVSYASVAILAFVFDAPDTFGASQATTAKAICIGAMFSVVGAATADSLFG